MKKGLGHYSTDTKRKILYAIENGKTPTEINQTFGVSRSTIYQWKKADSLERRSGTGPQSRLSLDEVNQLLAYIQQPASEFGYENDLWTGPRITQFIEKTLGKRLHRTTVYRMLTEENQSYKQPEYRWEEADAGKQDHWIKNTVPAIKRYVTRHNAILYFVDEATIQLTPSRGKTWGPKGKTSIVSRTGKRGRICAISAISPKHSLVFSLQKSTFKTDGVISFLDQIQKRHKNRKIVVVMDNARAHTSKQMNHYLNNSSNLKVYYLPSYSPQWNPDEKVWNHLKSCELVSHKETTIEGLEKLARKKLRSMQRRPKLLRGLFMRCEIAKFFA